MLTTLGSILFILHPSSLTIPRYPDRWNWALLPRCFSAEGFGCLQAPSDTQGRGKREVGVALHGPKASGGGGGGEDVRLYDFHDCDSHEAVVCVRDNPGSRCGFRGGLGLTPAPSGGGVFCCMAKMQRASSAGDLPAAGKPTWESRCCRLSASPPLQNWKQHAPHRMETRELRLPFAVHRRPWSILHSALCILLDATKLPKPLLLPSPAEALQVHGVRRQLGEPERGPLTKMASPLPVDPGHALPANPQVKPAIH